MGVQQPPPESHQKKREISVPMQASEMPELDLATSQTVNSVSS